MKLFENRRPGNYTEGSPNKAAITRTTTQQGNVFWLLKTPFTIYGDYCDPDTFEMKNGRSRLVYKIAKGRWEKYYVPIQ
jgi:hypothetical protein|tara:strand:+ start:272 stop:508 length:237 start_codon:yes stop_codon:yes gene_type:complete